PRTGGWGAKTLYNRRMRAMKKRHKILLAFIASIAVFALILSAAQGFSQQKSNPDPVEKMAADLSGQFHASILIDPALGPGVRPDSPVKDLSIEAALDRLVSRMPHAVWKRVYLSRDARQPRAGTLAAAARALDRISLTRLILENPET